jgi:SAM-dependent methyltransferase
MLEQTSHPQDEWLKPWLPIITATAQSNPVLELGCGNGHDTVQLTAAGLRVIGIELSAAELSIAQQRAPNAMFYQQDLRAPFPQEAQNASVIVASLCLHYFSCSETQQIVERLHAALPANGLLLCRLNSTNDHFFGATGHREIEPDYFDVNGIPKRFFSETSARQLFEEDWHFLSVREYASYKYAQPKWLWELILRKPDLLSIHEHSEPIL